MILIAFVAATLSFWAGRAAMGRRRRAQDLGSVSAHWLTEHLQHAAA